MVEIHREKVLFAKDFVMDALGKYQEQNLQSTLMSVELLAAAYGITKKHITKGLADLKKSTYYIGRWQVLQQDPKVIADSGHNKEGFAEAMKQLKMQDYEKLHLIIGFSKGKDHRELLQSLPREASYYWTKPSVIRALPLSELQLLSQEFSFPGDYFGTVQQALDQALSKASPNDLIFIGGSSFTVADALHCF
jgi:dihydrofolate synthase/folylpolyglutamate synthase